MHTAMPHHPAMHTVAMTAAFLAQAKAEGMTEAEMTAAVLSISGDPEQGDLIQGSGGCRKVRVAGKGKGKSGGYRVVTFFGGLDMPIFLIAVLAKGSRANFSAAEVKAMSSMTSLLRDAYARKRS
jgi:hypothetical protein